MPETLNTIEAAALLGVSRKTFWELRKKHPLERVLWSHEKRPRFRREDVLALKHTRPAIEIEGTPEWRAGIERRAREAAEYAERGEAWPPADK